MTVRRVHRGVSLSCISRWEFMVCCGGFFSDFSVQRQPGFMRICLGTSRVYLVWPS